MPATWEPLGPCTVELTIGEPGTPVDFAGEFKNGFVLHEYTEVGEAWTSLDGTEHPTTEKRADGFRGDTASDLTAAGLYQFLYTNDLALATLTFTQETSGAAWTGEVKLKLPAEVGADEFGAPVVASIEWRAPGVFTYTPATTTP